MKFIPRISLALTLSLFAAASASAQNKDWYKMSDEKKSDSTYSTPARTGPSRGQAALESPVVEDEASPKLTKQDTYIRKDSTVFIDEMSGFENYLAAAMRKKSVPLIVVADPMKADYIIFGNSSSKRAGWAKMFFLRSGASGEMASMMMVDRRTKVVVFADSSHRYSSNRGQRSTAEKLAKFLGKKINQDQKRMRG